MKFLTIAILILSLNGYSKEVKVSALDKLNQDDYLLVSSLHMYINYNNKGNLLGYRIWRQIIVSVNQGLVITESVLSKRQIFISKKIDVAEGDDVMKHLKLDYVIKNNFRNYVLFKIGIQRIGIGTYRKFTDDYKEFLAYKKSLKKSKK